jgi:hypothetical protein
MSAETERQPGGIHMGVFALIIVALLMLCGGLGATYGVHIPNVGFAGLSMGTIMTIVIVWVLIK